MIKENDLNIPLFKNHKFKKYKDATTHIKPNTFGPLPCSPANLPERNILFESIFAETQPASCI